MLFPDSQLRSYLQVHSVERKLRYYLPNYLEGLRDHFFPCNYKHRSQVELPFSWLLAASKLGYKHPPTSQSRGMASPVLPHTACILRASPISREGWRRKVMRIIRGTKWILPGRSWEGTKWDALGHEDNGEQEPTLSSNKRNRSQTNLNQA